MNMSQGISEADRIKLKLIRLNNTINALRKVNQLITKEKDINKTLDEACKILVENRGYHNAWIELFKKGSKKKKLFCYGLDGKFKDSNTPKSCDNLFHCQKEALAKDGIAIISNPIIECKSCPIKKMYAGRSAYSAQLVHDSEFFGTITVSLDKRLANDPDELDIFKELVGDLSFAIHTDLLNKTKEKSVRDLKLSEQKFKSYIEFAPTGIFILNENGKYTDVNKAASHLTGYTRKELLTMGPKDLAPPTLSDDVQSNFEKLSNSGVSEVEVPFLTKSGEKRTWYINSIKLSNNKYMGFTTDTTDKNEYIEELMDREGKYKTLTQNLNVGVYRRFAGKSGKFDEVNNAFLKIFGFKSRADLDYWKLRDLYANTDDLDRVEQILNDKGFLLQEKLQLRKKDGIVFDGFVSSTLVKNSTGKVIFVDGIIEDISELTKAQNEQEKYRKELKSFTYQLSQTQEEQKREMAQYLHDELGQSLMAVKLAASELNKKINGSGNEKLYKNLIKPLDHAISATRKTTYELSPPTLYELGLVSAIEWKLEDVQKDTGVKIKLTDTTDAYQLSTRTQVVLYRCIVELINNVIKHAKANKITVNFELNKESYIIKFIDDGIGFDLDDAKEKAVSEKKFGLFSLIERMDYIGGNMQINSKRRKGTIVDIKVPIKN